MATSVLSSEELVRKLDAHPHMRDRIASLLAIVDDEGGDLALADEAEARVIEEIRRMGQEALQTWANHQVMKTSQDVERSGQTWRDGKKNCAGTAHLATLSYKSSNTAEESNG